MVNFQIVVEINDAGKTKDLVEKYLKAKTEETWTMSGWWESK